MGAVRRGHGADELESPERRRPPTRILSGRLGEVPTPSGYCAYLALRPRARFCQSRWRAVADTLFHVTGVQPSTSERIRTCLRLSRPQITKALADLGAEPITHLINTHWHFDHTDGNPWLNSEGAKIIAQENTRKYLSEVQRVDDWDYNFLPLPAGGIPSEVFATSTV